MKKIIPISSKKNAFLMATLLSLFLTSCGSYQNSSYYENDGIYGRTNRTVEAVPVERYETQEVITNEYAADYQDEFRSMKDDFVIFTDVNQYNSGYENDSTYVTQNRRVDQNAGWGNNGANVEINYFNNGWNNWGNNWGWGGMGWNNGWYGNNWGWNGWYGNNWGWGGMGWNNWGWNGWYGNNWGWNGFYGPGWGWNNGWAGNNWGWNNNLYNGRDVVYNSGRRGRTSNSTNQDTSINGRNSSRNSGLNTTPIRSSTRPVRGTTRNTIYAPTRDTSTRPNTNINSNTRSNTRSNSPSRSYTPSRSSSPSSGSSRGSSVGGGSRSSGGSSGGGRSSGGSRGGRG
jgi:hypothetical protein